MEKGMNAKTINVKINYDGVKTKTLPSPSRFLELQGIKDRDDIEELTKNVLRGEKKFFEDRIRKNYSKEDKDIEFLWMTYNDLIFRFVVLSVSID